MFLFLLTLLSLTTFSAEIRIINDGQEALKVRMALIEKAQKSIDMSYFIFANDETSHLFLAKVREAKRRGVKVRILIDEMFNAIPKYVSTHLDREGIDIKVYNKVKLKNLRHLTRRLHDKMFLVDNEFAILGGRNIENTYYDLSSGKKNYDDRDILVIGDVVNTFVEYYNNIWNAKHVQDDKIVKRIRSEKRKDKLAQAEILLDNTLTHNKSFSEIFDLASLEMKSVNDELLTFAHDNVQLVKSRDEGTANQVYSLIENAQLSVLIDSPYFILTPKSRAVIARAIARGVKVRLITNSLKATDGILPQAAYIGQRKDIVELGVEVYEYFGDYSFHSKSLVIDEKIAVVGSFNFDYLSERNNTETMVIIRDEVVAQDLAADMATTLLECYKLDGNGRPEGYDRRYPEVTRKKIFLTKLVQYLLVPLIKTQL
jgi:putative cardiolipin synthase